MIELTNIPDKTEFKNTTSHKFKQDLVSFFRKKQLAVCLEIGTNHGWTTKVLSGLFEKVYSVDHSSDNHKYARQNTSECANIVFITADAYAASTYEGISSINVAFIDCAHTYDAVIRDINTALGLLGDNTEMYLVFDDYGHPQSTGVKDAILEAIAAGLSVEEYIGQPAGYSYNSQSTLIDHEGIILKYA